MTTETETPQSVHLHMIPINLDEWTHLTAFLSCAEEGALMRAVRVSWAAGHRGEAPGTLPDDDKILTRLLGGEAEQVALIRRYFAPDGEGRLRWEWLAALYERQVARYEARKAAADVRWGDRADGRPPRAVGRRNSKRGKQLSRGRCNAHALHVQPELESSSTKKIPARDTRTRGAPSAASAVASHAAPAPPAPPNREPTPLEVDAWVQANPGDAAEIEQAVDAFLDDLNPRWRQTTTGGAIRTKHIRARVSARMLEARQDPVAGEGLERSSRAACDAWPIDARHGRAVTPPALTHTTTAA